MSRFGKLEFETGPDSSGQQSLRPAAGEAHWSSEAERSFCLGDFELALRLFARVLEHNPTSVPAWAGQVRSLIELGEFREARLWADKALERFPQASELLAAKAVALGRLGDHDNAIAFSDASIEERGILPMSGWLVEMCSCRAVKNRPTTASSGPAAFNPPTGPACG